MSDGNMERLAVVEEQIKQLVTAVNGLSSDIKDWQHSSKENFVPRQELNEMFRSRDQSIEELRQAVKSAANKSDIVEIKEALKELKEDKKSNLGLFAAWAGVGVSALAVAVAFIAMFIN